MPELMVSPLPPRPSPARALPPVLAPTGAPAPRAVAVLPPLGSDVYPRLAVVAIAVLAVLTVVLHVVVNLVTPYGLHRDELLYIAMGQHLRMWQMDFPPFVALISELTRSTFGDTLAALRLGPAFASAATVALAALTARVMGGFRTAQVLAGIAVLASPLFLRAGNLLQPVVFDQLWWTAALYALAHLGRDLIPTGTRRHNAWADGRPHRSPAHGHAAHRHRRHAGHVAASLATLLDRPTARWWLLLGAAAGVGALTKFSIAFIAAGILVGLLATPLRRSFATPWPWIALAVAAIIGAPSIAGQQALGWPVFGQLRELQAVQLDRVGPLDFLAGQLAVGPALALAVYGMWVLCRHPGLRPFRPIAWACGTAFVLLLVLHGKAYYAGPIYPALIAAGAVGFEHATDRRRGGRRQRTVRGAVALALGAFAALTLPLSLPIVGPEPLARYVDALGPLGAAARTSNRGERLAIPQDFADMLGWPQQVAAVARAVATLPPEAQAEAVILAGNYGEAGAIDFFGPRLRLPPVVSPAGSYWYFGPGVRTATTAVAIGIPEATLRRYFRRVRPLERVRHEWGAWVVPEERDVLVAVCEEPLTEIQTAWPSLRPY